ENDASFPREETRHHLVLPLEDEAAPRSPAGRRGGISFPLGEMPMLTVPPDSRRYMYRYPVGPEMVTVLAVGNAPTSSAAMEIRSGARQAGGDREERKGRSRAGRCCWAENRAIRSLSLFWRSRRKRE
ncbi:hypothetical protein B296_00008978, partial [Ensete ventricosum]